MLKENQFNFDEVLNDNLEKEQNYNLEDDINKSISNNSLKCKKIKN
jgi:hypothetical protein